MLKLYCEVILVVLLSSSAQFEASVSVHESVYGDASAVQLSRSMLL